MLRNRVSVWACLTAICSIALASTGVASVAASTPAIASKAHHKRHKTKHHKAKHHKAKHHKTTSPRTDKLGSCSTTVNGVGPVLETNTYDYDVILACGEGEFGAFQLTTNRAIAAGSVTAELGTRYQYTCEQTASTSLSCSGVNVKIPPYEEGALRVLFKSTEAVCINGAPESATITSEGETFNAKVLSTC